MTYGAPYKTDQERENYPEDMFDALLEVAIEAGFEPADECLIRWIAERYEGWKPIQRWTFSQQHAGYLCFNTADDLIHLYDMSPTGVCRAEATFTYNSRGLAMFAAALKELP